MCVDENQNNLSDIINFKNKYMRKIKSILITFGILTPILTLCSLTLVKPDDGFVRLFNGKNFDNWTLTLRNNDAEMAKKVFTIDKKGVIHVFKDFPEGFGSKTDLNATHGMMWSNKKYSKFIFKFEYKWGKTLLNNSHVYQYDAGFYYHCKEPKIWPVGVEYQVRYNHIKNINHTGDFWAPGDLVRFDWTADKDDKFAFIKDGGQPVPRKKGEHAASAQAKFNGLNGKWNTCEVIVMGSKYAIHKLNGKVVNYATNLTLEEGIIGLQSETGEIFYRNIMIKELNTDIPAEEFLK